MAIVMVRSLRSRATHRTPAPSSFSPIFAALPNVVEMARLNVLDRHGYEPCNVGRGQIDLANSPFDRLAEQHRTLVRHEAGLP
jgi:hypothetical protein